MMNGAIITRTPQDGADTIVATIERATIERATIERTTIEKATAGTAAGGGLVLRTFGQEPRLIIPSLTTPRPASTSPEGRLEGIPMDTPVRFWGSLDDGAGAMEIERWQDATECTLSVLLCGGRDFRGWKAVERVLDLISPELIIHGAARGADSLAGQYARRNEVPCREFPAFWKPWGPGGPVDRGAGHDRNQKMLDEGRPDIVLAMPGGKGTQDMVRRSRQQGFDVHIHDHRGVRRHGNPGVIPG